MKRGQISHDRPLFRLKILLDRFVDLLENEHQAARGRQEQIVDDEHGSLLWRRRGSPRAYPVRRFETRCHV